MPAKALRSARTAAHLAIEPRSSQSDASSSVARPLRAQLNAIWQLLKAAHKVGGGPNRPPELLEPVHQLRVLSRRANESIKLFKKMLPAKPVEEMRGLLRRIRKAADEARDLDVMILSLEQNAAAMGSPEDTGATASLVQTLGKSRVQAQERISEAIQLLSRIDFPAKIKRLADELESRAKADSLGAKKLARKALSKSARKFFEAGRADLTQDLKLHQLRIRAKKLRYTMELIAPCFDKKFEKFIALVTLIQELSGDIHDHFAAIEVFTGLREDAPHPHERSYFEGLIQGEMRAHTELKTIFQSVWSVENRKDLHLHIEKYVKP